MKKLTLRISIYLIVFLISAHFGSAQSTSAGNGLYWYSFPWPTGTIAVNKKTSGLTIDSTKAIWVATQKYGVIKFLNGQWSSFYNIAGGQLPSNEVLCINSSGNNVYVGTKSGIAVFNGINWTKHTMSNSTIADSTINCILARNNKIYAGTNKGICVYDGANWSNLSMVNSQIICDTVISIEMSSNGDLWAGTIRGLSRLSGTTWSNYDSLNSNLKDNKIYSLCVDNSNSLWLSTSKSGIYKFNGTQFDSLSNIYPAYKLFSKKPVPLSKSQNGGIIHYYDDLKSLCFFSATHYSIPVNIQIPYKCYLQQSDTLIWIIPMQTPNTGLYYLNTNEASLNDDYNYVDKNNLKASISSSGTLFWDKEANLLTEMPKGSGKTAIFSAGLWIGAKDNQGNLHLAAERYRANGADFFFGPVMDTNFYQAERSKWNHVWKVNKSEIDFHNSHWWTTGYQIPESIKNWPGNGDISKGQSKNIAPYFDLNANGTYDPQIGDYPIIRGDQAIFFVFNDIFEHIESWGNPLKVEIHGMAYEFDKPNDSVLNNTLFLSYRVINKSQNNYDSLFLGLFTDMDLGYAYDDYVGCDTALSMYYCYNGMAIDGNGANLHYGANPPAIGTVFLNNTMSSFMFINNGGNPNLNDPDSAKYYYNYMKAIWKDGSHMKIGGNGHNSGGGTGPEYNYMFPGNIGGNCPANLNPWTEETAGNAPNDRRGLGSVGPYNLPIDASFCFDVAYVFARDYNNSLGYKSVNLLKQRVGDLRTFYNTNLVADCHDFNTKIETTSAIEPNILVFPNPTRNSINISRSSSDKIEIEVYDFTGKLITKVSSFSANTELNLSGYNPGIYLISIRSEQGITIKKIIKIEE